MLVRIGYDIIYELNTAHTMLLVLSVHPEVAPRLRFPELIKTQPDLRQQIVTDPFGNRVVRIAAPAGPLRVVYDNIIEDSGKYEAHIQGARLHPIEELPAEVLPYLLSSRYCEVDKLSQFAWDLFGKTPETWERVQAIMDWTHSHITFGYEFANSSKGAIDIFNDRRGVCRDFQHLAITMMRAMNIPARYATGYMPDIGVPLSPMPMDFSAWFEVYLGGQWYTMDARHNEPRIARVLMARGRDATDVALSTSFGLSRMSQFKVWADEITDPAVVQMEPSASVKVGPLIVPTIPDSPSALRV